MERGTDGSRWFEVLDPEGNKVQFVQPPAITRRRLTRRTRSGTTSSMWDFMVHDRAAEDKFYRDLLGFRPYWWGGRDGKVEWVSQQVPDGHDWIEYMMSRGAGHGDSGGHDAADAGRDGPLLDWRGFGSGRVSKCWQAGTGWRDGTTRRRRSGSTGNTSSICTIPTGFARK